MIDILHKLITGEIDENQAYDIFDEIVDKHDNGQINVSPKDYLNLNNYEYTAFAHGADFETLAKWRKEGWPSNCFKCGNKIDYKKYGWRIKDSKLECLKCS